MPVRSEAVMGTIVTIQAVSAVDDLSVDEVTARAFGWFHQIEDRCTRFNRQSELMRISEHVGEPVAVSEILFEAVRFALSVAEETGGAFDPTVGRRMEKRGFNREYRTGEIVHGIASDGDVTDTEVSYKDIRLDPDRRTITLLRPLTLDLGGVAKGLAIDMAARELAYLRNFAIDAGGDLYLGGLNPQGEPWSVGIRHPRVDGRLIESLRVSDQSVCTSGDYERQASSEDGEEEHHILDPRTGRSPRSVASATVVAGGAMLADALATAAFVLGPRQGIQLLDRMGVGGLIFSPDLQRYETRGLSLAA